MEKLKDKAKAIEDKLPEIAERTVNRACEEGKEIIYEKAQNMRYGHDYLEQEKKAYQESFVTKARLKDKKMVGSIQTKNPHAVYAENGTGVVGSQNPNTAIKGWKYDINQHGEAGWNYFADGSFHHTKGLPAFKIYYSTRQELRKRIKEIFKEEMKGYKG